MITVVSALIVRDGRALLTQRPAGKACAFCWETPGGKMDVGDASFHDGLRREVREELGIELGALPEEACVVQEFPSVENMPAGLKPFRMLTYFASEWTGTPTAREGQGIGWFLPAEMVKLTLAPANTRAVFQLQALVRAAGVTT